MSLGGAARPLRDLTHPARRRISALGAALGGELTAAAREGAAESGEDEPPRGPPGSHSCPPLTPAPHGRVATSRGATLRHRRKVRGRARRGRPCTRLASDRLRGWTDGASGRRLLGSCHSRRLLCWAASGGLGPGRGAARTPEDVFPKAGGGCSAGPGATAGAAESRGVGGEARHGAGGTGKRGRSRRGPSSSARAVPRRSPSPVFRRPAAALPESTPSPPRVRRGRAWSRSRTPPPPNPEPTGPESPPSPSAPRPDRARPPPPPAGHCEVRPAGALWGPGETPGAAAAASSCRRHRRPLHRLPRPDLAGRAERHAAWGPAPVPHPVKG